MKKIFTFRWILTTLLVLAGVAVLIRLGFWQLDRLAQRRAFNARLTAQLAAPALDLNQSQPLEQLTDMEYRTVTVRGTYDFSQEVLLRNQARDNQIGYRVLTPLKIDGTSLAVLVDRGWIPYDQADPATRMQYQEPGQVEVTGMIRQPELRPVFGDVADPTLAPGQTRLDAWNIVDVPRIQEQTSLSLLPVWIQEAPDPAWSGLPYRTLPQIEISEGPHLSYAIQWFSFAAILGLGFPFYVRWRVLGKPRKKKAVEKTDAIHNDHPQSDGYSAR